MLRRLLLAVLFCLSAWTVTENARPSSAHPDATVAATAATTTTATIGANVASPPIDTHPPEARWEVLLPQGLGGGSSRTQDSQPHALAAEHPGVSSRVPWPAVQRTDAEKHATRFRSAHLLHTPLLI